MRSTETASVCHECGVSFEHSVLEPHECACCLEEFCPDHLSDQCACSDDGSGQYVEDAGDWYCSSCHGSIHEPPEDYAY
jgi:hypothetical protein